MNYNYNEEIQKTKDALLPFKAFIKKQASGKLPFDYLVPGGPYQAQYDWDSFFMGVSIALDISSEAIYLRNFVFNQISNSLTNGKVSGCITPKGFDERYNHMKPFLAQGAYFAGMFLNDYSWLNKIWAKLKKIILYREKNQWSSKYDLGVWSDGNESGMDNNVALLDYPKNSIVAADLNAYIYLEYKAAAMLARIIKRKKDEQYFLKRTEEIKTNIQKYLWDEKDKIYYNLNLKTEKSVKRISISSLIPLFAGIPSLEQAKNSINKYLFSPSHFWSDYGIRSLSKSDPDYNNKNIIKPFSNWQGPIWPLINYLVTHILLRYGFQKEAIELAQKTTSLILDDIKNSGGMHENYDAETGKPLAADNKVSWNLLFSNLLREAVNNTNPFLI